MQVSGPSQAGKGQAAGRGAATGVLLAEDPFAVPLGLAASWPAEQLALRRHTARSAISGRRGVESGDHGAPRILLVASRAADLLLPLFRLHPEPNTACPQPGRAGQRSSGVGPLILDSDVPGGDFLPALGGVEAHLAFQVGGHE